MKRLNLPGPFRQGRLSGPLLVSVAPSMNDSNVVQFAVTWQPLPPSWVDQDVGVKRSGNVFAMYGSSDGVNWTQVGASQTVTMASSVYLGLAVSNRTTTSLATATFDNVFITSP